MEDLEKIAVLDNEVQARFLDAILTDRGIPHVMQSYHSLAYDGVFQLTRGWGHVEAPSRFRDEVLAVLEDIASGEQDDPDSENPAYS